MAVQAGFLGLLDHWQTLAGAVIGGALGVIGAWIVATMTICRQRWIAASALLPDTQQLVAAHEALERTLGAVEPPVAGWYQPQWRAERLLRRRPMVQVLHDRATSTQVTDLDARLSAHLTHCRMAHAGFEELLDEFARTLNTSRAPGVDVPTAMRTVRQRAVRVNQAWDLCAEHAALATYFMDRFIYNPWPNLFHRRRQLQEVLLDLWEEPGRAVPTVVFVTHDVDEALLLADRVVAMRSGVIVDDIPVQAARPRDTDTLLLPEVVEIKHTLLGHLGLAHAAQTAAGARGAA